MIIYYSLCFFLLGLVCGSFYTVIGYRLPKMESLSKFPYCTMCYHKLKIVELIPIFSFLVQRGRCRYCKEKISQYYIVFEFLTGILFLLSYLKFGFNVCCLMAILVSSFFVIVMISDYKYYMIPDVLIVVGAILIGMSQFFIGGGNLSSFDFKEAFVTLGDSIINGMLSVLFMYMVKLLGDVLFKKESMGGGDIKLMFIIGMILGFPLSIITLFIASIIGFPIALILMKRRSTIIPFGPLLSVATLLLFFWELTWKDIITILVG